MVNLVGVGMSRPVMVNLVNGFFHLMEVPCQFLILVNAKFDMLQTFCDQTHALSEMDMPLLVVFGTMGHSLMTSVQQLMPMSQVMPQPPALVVQVVSQRTTNVLQMAHAVSHVVFQMVDRPVVVLRAGMMLVSSRPHGPSLNARNRSVSLPVQNLSVSVVLRSQAFELSCKLTVH